MTIQLIVEEVQSSGFVRTVSQQAVDRDRLTVPGVFLIVLILSGYERRAFGLVERAHYRAGNAKRRTVRVPTNPGDCGFLGDAIDS